jgi:PAS domain S-box-containing protein
MTLRRQILLIISVTFVSLIVILYVAANIIRLGSFADLFLSLLMGLVFGLATLLLMERLVLARLARLNASVSRIGAAGDPSARVEMPGRDELSNLAGAINGMLETLEQSERTLRESEERFRRMADHIQDGITIIEGDQVVYVNDRACEIFGYPRDELIQLSGLDIAAPEEKARLQRVLDELQRTDNPLKELEFWIIRKDGTRCYIHNRYSVSRRSDRTASRYVVTTDITERTWAEADLRRLKDFSEGIIQSMAEGITVEDTRGYFTFVNPAAAALLGYAPEELVGLHWTTVIPPDQQPIIQAADERRLRGEADRYEVELVRKDGKRVPVLISGSPRFEGGQLAGTLAVFTDISERVQAEVEREHLLAAEREQRQVAETLREAAVALTSALDLRQVLDGILDHLEQVIPYDSACVFLLEGDHLHAVAGRGFPVPEQVLGRDYPVHDDALFREVLRSQRPLYLVDAGADPRFKQWGGSEIVHGWMCVPLVVRSEVIGCLTLDSQQIAAYGEAQATLAQAFASQAAVAIENARLFAAERATREQAEALREAAQVMGVSLELNEILRLILDQLKRVLVYDTASVLVLREGDAPDLVVGIGYADEQLVCHEAGRLLRDSPILRRMAQDLQPVVIADVRQLDGWVWVPGAEHVRSWIGIPLVARGQMIGALMADHSRLSCFGEREVQIAQALAQHAAQALDRARLFAQMQEQAQQVQQIMDTVPEGVLLLDAASRTRLTNAKAQAYLAVLTDAQAEEPLTHLGGRPVAELLVAPPQGLWHEVKTIGFPYRTFEVAARPMETGLQTWGWVLVLRDVTQEREIQQRAQDQQRLAAVGQLAAGIAHDFNNILTSMIGYAQLLQRRSDTSDFAQERLNLIVQQGFRAAQLVRQILDFSRQSLSEKHPLNLVPFCKEIVKLLQRTIPENIVTDFGWEPGDHWVNADPAQLQQTLMNLAVNARDAMPAGGTLSIQLAQLRMAPGMTPPLPRMSPGDWVVLSISDTGTGIAPEHMAHLFEPFFTTKEVGKGTGLGLAQVYGLVTQHGGFIGVASEVDNGTTFTIYLPALQTEPAATPATPKEVLTVGHGETILLVEDEPTVLGVSQDMLEQLGYRVRTATTGAEALQVYDQHADEIVLVLTDMVMPQMDGVALYEALRARDPEVKVVVVSGYPLGEKAQEILTAGIAAWLQKPIQMAQLMQVISRALSRT